MNVHRNSMTVNPGAWCAKTWLVPSCVFARQEWSAGLMEMVALVRCFLTTYKRDAMWIELLTLQINDIKSLNPDYRETSLQQEINSPPWLTSQFWDYCCIQSREHEHLVKIHGLHRCSYLWRGAGQIFGRRTWLKERKHSCVSWPIDKSTCF